MTTLKTLKQSARESATYRGHKLGRWHSVTSGRSATADCVHCACGVTVDTRPPPNGIDIGGSAVAIGCDGPYEAAARAQGWDRNVARMTGTVTYQKAGSGPYVMAESWQDLCEQEGIDA
jgi:hypothetical protein